ISCECAADQLCLVNISVNPVCNLTLNLYGRKPGASTPYIYKLQTSRRFITSMNYSKVGGEVGGISSLGIGVGALGASTNCPSAIGNTDFMSLPTAATVTTQPTLSLTFPTSSTFTFLNTASTSPSSSYYTGPGSSPPVLPPVSRPSLANMWGIGGFRSPTLPIPPPMPPNTVPSTMGNPQMPSASYFTAPRMGFNFRMSGTSFIYKRKQDEDIDELTPKPKQQITEEKMAAHMNALHISEQFKNHCLDKRSRISHSSQKHVWDMEGDDDSDSDTAEQSLKPTGSIVIAKEVQQIIPGDNKLPQSLFKKYTEPSMEMVLWKPPGDIIRNIITTKVNEQQQQLLLDEVQTFKDSRTSSSATDAATIIGGAPTSKVAAPMGSSAISRVNGVIGEPSTSGTTSSSASSSPDSGISLSSPPPSLSFLAGTSTRTNSASYDNDNGVNSSSLSSDLGPFPSTSSGIVSNGANYFPPLGRPPSPLPEAYAEEDFSDRMEFNNNNGNAPNYMWLEENNNSALMDLNVMAGQQRPPNPEDLPPLPDDADDMDL
ncbi:unnamed protein product, partial [Meganyctiphanes norvegica]